MKRLTTSTLISLLSMASFGNPPAKELLSSNTEFTVANAQSPSRKIVDAILKSEDKISADILKDCLTEKKLKPYHYEFFFDSVSLPKLKSDQDIYFVRPSREPYCFAFYGAHLFRYWIVTKAYAQYKIAYAGRADQVEILSASHKNIYDIAETNCTADGCNRVTMRFDGKKYKISETQYSK